jgi:hypothetical protein
LYKNIDAVTIMATIAIVANGINTNDNLNFELLLTKSFLVVSLSKYFE